MWHTCFKSSTAGAVREYSCTDNNRNFWESGGPYATDYLFPGLLLTRLLPSSIMSQLYHSSHCVVILSFSFQIVSQDITPVQLMEHLNAFQMIRITILIA